MNTFAAGGALGEPTGFAAANASRGAVEYAPLTFSLT
jgi:hypothetical protein